MDVIGHLQAVFFEGRIHHGHRKHVVTGFRQRARDGGQKGDRIYHLDRGYDRMEDKLRALGADIERTR